MEKMTKKEMFDMIREVCADNMQIVEFCNHEIELLEKKKASSKMTKTQTENVEIKKDIINVLGASNVAMSITDIMNALDSDFSNQKISALVTQLVKENIVTRDTVKGKAVFVLVK